MIEDADVKKIIDAAEVMKVSFRKLEARQKLSKERYDAVCSAANTFRFFYGIEISNLRAAFDPEYAAELEKLNKIAKKDRPHK